MNEPTNIQIIEQNGHPAFAVIPWHDFEAIEPALKRHHALRYGIPNAVAKKIMLEDMHPIKAWRKHLKLEQIHVAEKAGIQQSSLARIESGNGGKTRHDTLVRIAHVLGITIEQLALSD